NLLTTPRVRPVRRASSFAAAEDSYADESFDEEPFEEEPPAPRPRYAARREERSRAAKRWHGEEEAQGVLPPLEQLDLGDFPPVAESPARSRAGRFDAGEAESLPRSREDAR